MKKILALVLALRIEYHWWHIKLGRKVFDLLYSSGMSLLSMPIQKINNLVSRHSARAMLYEKKYREKYTLL